jgi:hypothetical protein
MLLRLPGGNIATLLIGPSTPVEARNRVPVHLSDFRVGDHVIAQARPDQQRALTYGAGTLRDLDLVPFTRRRGLITDVGQHNRTLTIRFGSTLYVVNIGKGTSILRPDGKKGAIGDLDTGDTVEVSGVQNMRLDEITTTTLIREISSPRVQPTPRP